MINYTEEEIEILRCWLPLDGSKSTEYFLRVIEPRVNLLQKYKADHERNVVQIIAWDKIKKLLE